jgi:hypothetical protein
MCEANCDGGRGLKGAGGRKANGLRRCEDEITWEDTSLRELLLMLRDLRRIYKARAVLQVRCLSVPGRLEATSTDFTKLLAG